MFGDGLLRLAFERSFCPPRFLSFLTVALLSKVVADPAAWSAEALGQSKCWSSDAAVLHTSCRADFFRPLALCGLASVLLTEQQMHRKHRNEIAMFRGEYWEMITFALMAIQKLRFGLIFDVNQKC